MSIASYMDHKDNEEKKASGLLYRNTLIFDELIFRSKFERNISADKIQEDSLSSLLSEFKD